MSGAVVEIISKWTLGQIEAAQCEGVPHADRAALAASWANSGRVDEAAAVLREVCEHAEDLRLLFLGFQFFFRTGDAVTAERMTRRRLEVAERIGGGETEHVARACTNLGTLLLTVGRGEEARGWCERALLIDERLGNQEGIARDLGNLANVFELAGDLDRAEALNRRALELAERIGAGEIAASRLANLGDIAEARGEAASAVDLWQRGLDAFERLGIEKWRAELADKIARVRAAPLLPPDLPPLRSPPGC
ncbi:MAG: tetratricopeptide repeat protein [Phycisphaerales bacterium]